MSHSDIALTHLNKASINGFTVYFRAEAELYRSYDEIFSKQIYHIVSSDTDKLIIDGGAHIGISALFLRKTFPHARIISFEPNPYTFEILKKNIAYNHITNIELVNAALAAAEGKGFLYGALDGDNADTRGNSTIQSWGDRNGTDKVLVDKVKLSSFLDDNVHFLKLDIEGAEHEVLCELGPKLDLVKHVFIDFHGVKTSAEANLKEIKALLIKHGFHITTHIKDPTKSLPLKWTQWIKSAGPVMAQIVGRRD